MQDDIIINAGLEQQQNINATVSDSSNISAGTTQRGAQGRAATIELGTVSTGAAGTDVIITNSGTESDAIFNFTIPRGTDGTNGQDGTAATVSIGTVSTGAAGTSATVINSGTSSAAVFDFVIPQGSTGASGTSASIVGVSATVDDNVGTPSVSVTMGGTETERTFDFAFYNLKGQDGSGTSYTLPIASSSTLGGIKVGNNLTIGADGTLDALGGGGATYSAGYGIKITNDTISTDTTIASKTDIGSADITIQRNGTAIGTINTNATSASTINISVPTTATDVGALPDTTTIGNGATTVIVDGTAIGTITANQTTDNSISLSIPSESTVSDWGFTKNEGTVTSVNNNSPDASGNVTLPTELVYPFTTIYVNGLSWYLLTSPDSDGYQFAIQGGRVAAGNGTSGSVQFLKEFTDANYAITSNVTGGTATCAQQSGATFNWTKSNAATGLHWVAFGRIVT
ncbi:MAG: hypothetical protein J6S67_20865 [Methanobrevibacter sp.]|nr:hypothetical protein [Methanobrevibacter sp.]